MSSTETGQLLAGRYRLTQLLAIGGMAEVWQAQDELLDRQVAIKILLEQFAADPQLRARFQNEAIAAARLIHPSIVSIYDSIEVGGRDAIVMELVKGRTLRNFLDERGRLDPIEVVHIGSEVCTALMVAHRAGVIHRDVKPANILLSDDGRVLVTDFGIAKVLDEPDITRTAQLVGTMKYLAPEQVEGGPVDGRTDIYALGAVLFEALCGEPPFRAESPAAVALARLHRDAPRPAQIVAGIPADLEQTILRALRREPSQRFPTIADMRAALGATRFEIEADATMALPTSTSEEPQVVVKSSRSRPAVVITLIIVAILIVIATLVGTAGRDFFSETSAVEEVSTPQIVALSSAIGFDPADRTNQGENNNQAPFAIDSDQLTVWNSETYPSRLFSGNRKGVGLVVTLAEPTRLTSLEIATAMQNWAVEVFVGNGIAPTVEQWGEPAFRGSGLNGTSTLDLNGETGDYVLIWFTDLGTRTPARATITDLTFIGESLR